MSPTRWNRLLSAASLLLTAAYPLAVYFLLDHGDVRLAGLAFLLVLAMRFLTPGSTQLQVSAALGAGALFATAITLTNSEILARLYPVAVSGVLLVAFGVTLVRPPSMIERIARATGVALNEPDMRYTRTVTVVWCGFFLLNGGIALVTALATSREVWALYNGLVSYLIAGAILAGERLIRPVFQRRFAESASR